MCRQSTQTKLATAHEIKSREYNTMDEKSKHAIESALTKQRQYFKNGASLPVVGRLKALKSFRSTLDRYQTHLAAALEKDLGRTPYESQLIELMPLLAEIDHACKKIKKWAASKSVKTPLLVQPAKSWLQPQPFGQTLIVAPWNYPVLLLLAPMIGAVAAGNTVLLVAAEETPSVAKVMQKIIKESFSAERVTMIPPGPDSVNEAIAQKMDYIFFTGSPRVGKIIMKQAAQHLTPVTLELGGKSPCILHKDADLDVSCRRIVWGRFTNSGQTCVAPDYLMVHEDILEPVKQKLVDNINSFYSSKDQVGPTKLKIINSKNYERLKLYLKNCNILYGGSYDDSTQSIAPTLVLEPSSSHKLSTEEIFGPILPIYTYHDAQKLLERLNEDEKPLASYLFTKDKHLQEQVARRSFAGGFLINDVMMHVASHHLPFGGVGQSGMGAYHGEHSFRTFTHYKPCLKKSLSFDFQFRYPPYPKKRGILKWISWFTRIW